ncbi:hypothetical protein [Methanosarcina sp.]|uniref:hypothetical protein n=1 Tax=Methanosarcina sp. TaxID=2213 RepID=UPI003C71670B
MRDFARDNSAWADFLISKAALILASVILFAALFHLAAGFKELEVQEQLDFLAQDFKTTVDRVGSGHSEPGNPGLDNSGSGNSESGTSGSDNLRSDNPQAGVQQGFQGEFQDEFQKESQDEFRESFYCFEENEVFRDSPFAGDLKVRVSGEYICLEAGYGERNFRAVRPFTFRVLPFNESVLHEKLNAEFGAWGNEEAPLKAGYSEIKVFLQALGTEEAFLNPNENISLKKKFIYVKDGEGVSAFSCVLVYQ